MARISKTCRALDTHNICSLGLHMGFFDNKMEKIKHQPNITFNSGGYVSSISHNCKTKVGNHYCRACLHLKEGVNIIGFIGKSL